MQQAVLGSVCNAACSPCLDLLCCVQHQSLDCTTHSTFPMHNDPQGQYMLPMGINLVTRAACGTEAVWGTCCMQCPADQHSGLAPCLSGCCVDHVSCTVPHVLNAAGLAPHATGSTWCPWGLLCMWSLGLVWGIQAGQAPCSVHGIRDPGCRLVPWTNPFGGRNDTPNNYAN